MPCNHKETDKPTLVRHLLTTLLSQNSTNGAHRIESKVEKSDLFFNECGDSYALLNCVMLWCNYHGWRQIINVIVKLIKAAKRVELLGFL